MSMPEHSLSDIAAASGESGFGGDNAWWAIILFAMIFGRGGDYSLSSRLADCCRTTQRGIDSVNYNGAIDTAAIQQTAAEQTQKVLDTITGNRMADMQNQIDRLQLSQTMCGVVRYPDTFAYSAGPSPSCGNGCCGTANI